MTYKEIARDVMRVTQENARLRRDNEWLRKVLAIALEDRPAVVVREDRLREAPAIEQSQNMANEIIIRVVR